MFPPFQLNPAVEMAKSKAAQPKVNRLKYKIAPHVALKNEVLRSSAVKTTTDILTAVDLDLLDYVKPFAKKLNGALAKAVAMNLAHHAAMPESMLDPKPKLDPKSNGNTNPETADPKQAGPKGPASKNPASENKPSPPRKDRFLFCKPARLNWLDTRWVDMRYQEHVRMRKAIITKAANANKDGGNNGNKMEKAVKQKPKKPIVVTSERWEAIKSSNVAKALPMFLTFPSEIQVMIWKESIIRPGIHFLAVALTRDSAVWDPRDPHLWKKPLMVETIVFPDGTPEDVEIWEPEDGDSYTRGLVRLVKPVPRPRRKAASFMTYAENFPAGCSSAYNSFDNAIKMCAALTPDQLRRQYERPLQLPLGDGSEVTIDAATDLVYIKFFSDFNTGGHNACHMYTRSPSADLFTHRRRDAKSFKGIRRVALEIDPMFLETCVMPESGNLIVGRTCIFCNQSRPKHGLHDTAFKNLAKFLHCFPDLDEVHLVFPWSPRWMLQEGVGNRFRADKAPPSTAQQLRDYNRAKPQPTHGDDDDVNQPTGNPRYRFRDRKGAVFECGGGTLREPHWPTLRNLKPTAKPNPLLRFAAVVAIMQWWYAKSEGSQPQEERMTRENVKFQMLVWDQPGGAQSYAEVKHDGVEVVASMDGLHS